MRHVSSEGSGSQLNSGRIPRILNSILDLSGRDIDDELCQLGGVAWARETLGCHDGNMACATLIRNPAHRVARRAAMRAGETELQMCVRHVAEQENRIARQDVFVARLRESGSPLLDNASQLLAEMYYHLKRMHEHVAVARLRGS
jgi:hypothetical protein